MSPTATAWGICGHGGSLTTADGPALIVRPDTQIAVCPAGGPSRSRWFDLRTRTAAPGGDRADRPGSGDPEPFNRRFMGVAEPWALR